jgi:hypothetical protein
MTLENPIKIWKIPRGWVDPFHVRYLKMEEDKMPNEYSDPSRPIMQSKREPAGNSVPGEGGRSKTTKMDQGVIQPGYFDSSY